jgi:hypothetical protein
VADGQRDQVVHCAGREGGEHLGQGGVPIVAHYMGSGDMHVGKDGPRRVPSPSPGRAEVTTPEP